MSNAVSAEAAVLRCGYDVGHFNVSDIISWADRQIESNDNPSRELLELSMARKAHPLDVMNLLRALETADSTIAIETQLGFLGLLCERQKLNAQLAVGALWAMVHAPGIAEEVASQIYYLDDSFDQAVAGTYCTMADVERELDSFLTPYAVRLAELHPHLIPATKSN